MKVYILIHSFNEEYEFGFFEVLAVYSTEEKALAKLNELVDDIVRGKSILLGDVKVLERSHHFAYKHGYTYKWVASDGATMYSHIVVKEMEVE